MSDMRHLYGLQKSAAAIQAEFKDNLAGFFKYACTEGLPYRKLAEEKREFVSGLLAKHAGCGKKAAHKQTVTKCDGGQCKKASSSDNPAVRQLAAKLARARKAQ